MDNSYTHVTFVLDRSGSMMSCWTDVLGGFQKFVSDQKQVEGKCTFSLVEFDNDVGVPINFNDIQAVNESLDNYNIGPRGSTALYDAIGRAINETGDKLASLSESNRPGKVLLVIQTDGYENASREYKAEQVKEMIKHQEEKYNWQVLFLGADVNSVNVATSHLGIKASNAAYYDYSNTKGMVDTFSSKVSQTRCFVGDTNSAAYSATVSFSEDERKAML